MQLSDEEKEFIEPYLPVGAFGPYPERLRQQFAGVVWRFKSGAQWREMPQELGAWSTVANRSMANRTDEEPQLLWRRVNRSHSTEVQ